MWHAPLIARAPLVWSGLLLLLTLAAPLAAAPVEPDADATASAPPPAKAPVVISPSTDAEKAGESLDASLDPTRDVPTDLAAPPPPEPITESPLPTLHIEDATGFDTAHLHAPDAEQASDAGVVDPPTIGLAIAAVTAVGAVILLMLRLCGIQLWNRTPHRHTM